MSEIVQCQHSPTGIKIGLNCDAQAQFGAKQSNPKQFRNSQKHSLVSNLQFYKCFKDWRQPGKEM